ncbi:MAG: hypothetical protein ABI723_03660 [Bacteroidia bacterium]
MLQLLWTLFFIVLFCWIVNRHPFFYHRRVHPLMFQFAFLLKIFAGIILTWIYVHFYTDRKTADIFKYFDDSKIMYDALSTAPHDFVRMFFGIHADDADLFHYYNKMVAWDDSDMAYNDNRIMIRFNCMMRFISFGNFYIHIISMCFITFYGLTCIFRLFASEVKGKYFGIFCAVFFMPSVVFWGSGVLKDGVILFATGLFLYNFNRLLNNSAHLKNKIFFALGLLLMMFVKVYVLAIMIPGLVMLLIVKRRPQWNLNKLRYWTIVYLLYGLSVYCLQFISGINVVELISLKQHQFMSLATAVGSGSLVSMPELSDTQSIVAGIPHALYNMFFQPFFWNKSLVIFIAGLENIFILVVSVICISKINRQNFYSTPWFFFSLFFLFILYCLIGLIVPVAGALVRYKTIALPFLAIMLVILIDKNKSDKLLSKLNLKF